MENHCDMAYQKYSKIVVSREVCLHYHRIETLRDPAPLKLIFTHSKLVNKNDSHLKGYCSLGIKKMLLADNSSDTSHVQINLKYLPH